jgi:hypothetical protein
MKAAYVFLVLFGLMMISVVHAGHSITMHYSGECPPRNEVSVRCWDLTGVVHISTTMPICQTQTFSVPNGIGTMVCIIECNGEEVYRKRYEFPGTPWKAPDSYPYDIVRAGDQPADEDINDTIDEPVRDPSKCGNGDIDNAEACDTNGNKGCDDPLKPVCYNCQYCGCSDASQCVQVSGYMACGTHGCAAYERPKFSVKCLDGICITPRKCALDPECIDKYQEERDKKRESQKSSYKTSSNFNDEDHRTAFYSEKLQGESPKVPVDSMGGTISEVLHAAEAETYTIDGVPYNVEVLSLGDTATLAVNGMEYELGEGESAEAGDAELEVTMIMPPTDLEAGSVYFHLSTVTEDDIRYMMYDGDYDAETGEIIWPPAEEPLPAEEEPTEERYRNIMEHAPATAKALLGNEKINFYVDGETAYVLLEDGVVVDAGEGEYEDNTVNVYTDAETVADLESGETNFKEALDEGRIIIEGEGFFNGMRFWLIKLFYDLGLMLG